MTLKEKFIFKKCMIISKKKPLVSVVIPFFNRAYCIERTLYSVKNQDYRPIELILVDDGSNDASCLVVEEWAKKNIEDNFEIKIYKQRNMGAPVARNRGIVASSGKYVQFLDSDDTINSVKIKFQVNALEYTGVDMAVCDFKFIYENSLETCIQRNDGDLYEKLIRGGSLSIFAPLIRLDVIKGKVWWNEFLKRQQDMDFFFKVLATISDYIYTPGVWCNYFYHDGDQISDQYKRKDPPFFTKILSLWEFFLFHYRYLTDNKKKFLIRGMVYLNIFYFRYYLGIIIKALLLKK